MDEVILQAEDVRKLLGSASGDAALLYLYLKSGGSAEAAERELRFTASRLTLAEASLRQMGLLEAPGIKSAGLGTPPVYTEADLSRRMEDRKGGFQKLVGEVQRRFGRTLSTEELKILLGMTDFLQLPTEVVGMLLSFCIERARRRGAQRMPSLRTVEKEAYVWAEQGIDSIETAAAYMQEQLQRYARVASVARALQIQERKLTPGEERYILSWLDMGFGEEAIRLGYARTCETIGTFKWNYLNSVLRNWDAAGLHTVEQIRQVDDRAQTPHRQRANQYQRHGAPVSPLGKQAIQKLLEEET